MSTSVSCASPYFGLYLFRDFLDSSVGKESACNGGDLGLIPGLNHPPGLGRSPGEGKGYPLQYSGEFHGLYSPWGGKSQTQLSDFHFHLHSQTCPGLDLFHGHPTLEATGDLTPPYPLLSPLA